MLYQTRSYHCYLCAQIFKKRQGCFSWGIICWHCNVVLAQSNLKRAPSYGAKGYHHIFHLWLLKSYFCVSNRTTFTLKIHRHLSFNSISKSRTKALFWISIPSEQNYSCTENSYFPFLFNRGNMYGHGNLSRAKEILIHAKYEYNFNFLSQWS